MEPYYEDEAVTLYQADARNLPIDDRSVHAVVTSPPYWGLRDYGLGDEGIGLEPTPELYTEHILEVFREVRRVLRDDGTLWLNLGDCYATGAGKVGSHPGGGARGANWKGATTSPNRMPLLGLKPKDLVGMPWRVAFALQTDGWYLRCDIIWSKPNPMPESAQDRPTRAHEYLFLLSKSERYYYDADAIRESAKPESTLRMRAGYHGNDVVRDAANHYGDGFQRGDGYELTTRNKRSVWHIPTQPYPDAHFATFPEKLVEPCILAGAPVGGLVLDPFAGSGTTCAVAQRLGRRAVGVDLSADYLELAVKRMGQAVMAL